VLTHTIPLPPPGAGVTDSFTPIMCGVAFAVGERGVAIATGPSAGISTLSFFCFFVLPTSTVGESIGDAVAFAFAGFEDDAKGHHPFFLVVCCFAGDSFT
jgi:hypothetical protein